MDDEETRLQSTALLGQLLALESCDVARSVPSLFDNGFLKRMHDVSPAVRAAAVEVAVDLVASKRSLAPPLLHALGERVLDADDKVGARAELPRLAPPPPAPCSCLRHTPSPPP